VDSEADEKRIGAEADLITTKVTPEPDLRRNIQVIDDLIADLEI
jgi:hypothetical protein